jgi:hypothetical protein
MKKKFFPILFLSAVAILFTGCKLEVFIIYNKLLDYLWQDHYGYAAIIITGLVGMGYLVLFKKLLTLAKKGVAWAKQMFAETEKQENKEILTRIIAVLGAGLAVGIFVLFIFMGLGLLLYGYGFIDNVTEIDNAIKDTGFY